MSQYFVKLPQNMTRSEYADLTKKAYEMHDPDYVEPSEKEIENSEELADI